MSLTSQPAANANVEVQDHHLTYPDRVVQSTVTSRARPADSFLVAGREATDFGLFLQDVGRHGVRQPDVSRPPNSTMRYFSTSLFAHSSLIGGAAHVLDFANTLNQYNRSSTPWQADRMAIASDWGCIGNDLKLTLEMNHLHGDSKGARRK